jgi:hypothetical protein
VGNWGQVELTRFFRTPQSSNTLHLSEPHRADITKRGKAEAVIYAGNDKTPVKLESAGENRMVARGNFKVGVGNSRFKQRAPDALPLMMRVNNQRSPFMDHRIAFGIEGPSRNTHTLKSRIHAFAAKLLRPPPYLTARLRSRASRAFSVRSRD